MAGSWSHVVNDDGTLISNEDFPGMIENLGDAYEAVEEMYWMVLALAGNDFARIDDARQRALTIIAEGGGWRG